MQIKILDSLSDEIKTLLECVGKQILHADTILVKEAQPSIDFRGGMTRCWCGLDFQLHAVEDSAMNTVEG